MNTLRNYGGVIKAYTVLKTQTYLLNTTRELILTMVIIIIIFKKKKKNNGYYMVKMKTKWENGRKQGGTNHSLQEIQ